MSFVFFVNKLLLVMSGSMWFNKKKKKKILVYSENLDRASCGCMHGPFYYLLKPCLGIGI